MKMTGWRKHSLTVYHTMPETVDELFSKWFFPRMDSEKVKELYKMIQKGEVVSGNRLAVMKKLGMTTMQYYKALKGLLVLGLVEKVGGAYYVSDRFEKKMKHICKLLKEMNSS